MKVFTSCHEVKIDCVYDSTTTTHWLPGGKNINLNSLLWALIKHWNMFELDGKVASVWVRGLVAVVFNIVLNTLRFILMAVLRQHVKAGEPICVTSTRANHRTLGHICSVSGTHCLLEHCGNTSVVKWQQKRQNHPSLAFIVDFYRLLCLLLAVISKCKTLKTSQKRTGPEWVSFPLAGCDSSHARDPQAAKDIQSPSYLLWTDLWQYWWAVPACLKRRRRANT